MASITATIGADIAPLKKGTQDAEALLKASSKRAADESKRLAKEAADAFKSAQAAQAEAIKSASDKATRATADAAARQKDLAAKTGASIRSALSAGNGGDLLGSGFEAISSLLGPIAGVAAGAGLIAKSMFDASEDVRTMKREMGQLRADTFAMGGGNASGGDLRAGASRISDDLRARARAKADAVAGLGGAVFDSAHANTVGGLVGEFFNDDVAEEKNRASRVRGEKPTESSAKDKELAETAASLAEVHRLTMEAVDADKDDLDVAQKRLLVSEHMAAIRESELATVREVAAAEREMGKQHFAQADIDKATATISGRGELSKGEIDRRDAEIKHGREEAEKAAEARAAAGLAGGLSPLKAAQMNIAETRRQAQDKRDQANISKTPDERHAQLMAEAKQLDIQAKADEDQLAQRRALMSPQQKIAERLGDSARARQAAAGARYDAAHTPKGQAAIDSANNAGHADTARNRDTIAAERARREGNNNGFFEAHHAQIIAPPPLINIAPPMPMGGAGDLISIGKSIGRGIMGELQGNIKLKITNT